MDRAANHTVERLLHRRLGALPLEDGSVRFRIWAPNHPELRLQLIQGEQTRSYPLERAADGYHELVLREAQPGDRYWYQLDSDTFRPDPASRYQPEGVHGPSEIIDPSTFAWTDAAWRGVAKSDLVIYEMHLGAFTEDGTYLAAIERLDELVQLGVTAIELMPLADSAGRWNWGYDGVDLFAPRSSYGSPDEFRRLVDAAHHRGLAVIVDVVYNHLGPEGNYLSAFGPYFSDKHHTPWGPAPNFDGPENQYVRDFFVANATYWTDEFHCDGLRIDAIHCMADDSEQHIVTEIGDAFRGLRQTVDRPLHLIAESNVYDSQMLRRLEAGGHDFDSLWCDDFLHSVFAVIRPGEHMSARQYSAADLHTTLDRGFVYEGTVRDARQRIPVDAKTDGRDNIESLVFAIQNHDFIGNHPLGQRLHRIATPETQRAAAALLLLYPAIPMLFMGEEFACENPFYFFVDYHDGHLRTAVEEGRRREYPQHDWEAGMSPLEPATFYASRIGEASDYCEQMLQWYRQLIGLRKKWKAEGILTASRMVAQWHERQHLALLRYGSGAGSSGFVAVRLAPVESELVSIDFDVDGQTLLTSYDEEGNVNVLVGEGSVEYRERMAP